MKTAYDIIVVGAGPAGSTAACELTRQGLKVALLEQKPLPRYKPCGGCLSLKIDGVLGDHFHGLVETTVYGATFTFAGLDPIRVRSDRPVAYMVMRDRFDHALALRSAGAGADLRAGERVEDVDEREDGVEVRTDAGTLQARFLVAADGANGTVGRRLGMTPERRVAVCVESEVTTSPSAGAWPFDEVIIECGTVPFGYGWVFPKASHLSVGVGGLQDRIGNPRDYYRDFLIEQELIDGGEKGRLRDPGLLERAGAAGLAPNGAGGRRRRPRRPLPGRGYLLRRPQRAARRQRKTEHAVRTVSAGTPLHGRSRLITIAAFAAAGRSDRVLQRRRTRCGAVLGRWHFSNVGVRSVLSHYSVPVETTRSRRSHRHPPITRPRLPAPVRSTNL